MIKKQNRIILIINQNKIVLKYHSDTKHNQLIVPNQNFYYWQQNNQNPYNLHFKKQHLHWYSNNQHLNNRNFHNQHLKKFHYHNHYFHIRHLINLRLNHRYLINLHLYHWNLINLQFNLIPLNNRHHNFHHSYKFHLKKQYLNIRLVNSNQYLHHLHFNNQRLHNRIVITLPFNINPNFN